VLLNCAALSFAIVITLWGAGRIARRLETLRETTSNVLDERQHRLLGAADALERGAEVTHEWPIDEGMVAWVITITTTVIAVAIGRLILSPLGL
jgi:hypothetical protein